MASVIENLRTEAIARLRLGILPPQGSAADTDLATCVLSPFDAQERDEARQQIQRAADACEMWLAEGCEATMNNFNRTRKETGSG